MAKQTILLGTAPTGVGGDTPRSAFSKAQSNFDELYAADLNNYKRSNILGAVGQSGGVPFGAVIERGSNANGEYVRFADGTQICTRRVSGQRMMNKASGALFYAQAEAAGAYPIAFAAQPSISIQATGYTYEVMWLGAIWNTPLAVWPAGYVMTEVSRTISDLIYIDYVANGRWF